ncbi:hypothetical protein LZL87_003622 [Fusarium oxysporum]|nr:hypothetical protein LZL87_003622 [Fusarium oxysporum]
MEKPDPCCCLCGIYIALTPSNWSRSLWLDQFYVVCTFDREANARAYLSTDGFRARRHDYIVADPADYRFNDGRSIRVILMPYNCERPLKGPLPLSMLPKAWGYPFHSACWKILNTFGTVDQEDLQSILNLCRSAPKQLGILNWGHGYRGQASHRLHVAPGEENFLTWSHRRNPEANPYSIVELTQIFDNHASNTFNSNFPESEPLPMLHRVISMFELDATPAELLDQKSWTNVSRTLSPPGKLFRRGCRFFHIRMLVLPSNLPAVYVSTIEVFERRYVSGLKFSDGDGKDFTIGFQNPRREELLAQQATSLQIKGFGVAFDQHGVRGICILFGDDTQSHWAGEPSSSVEQDLPACFALFPNGDPRKLRRIIVKHRVHSKDVLNIEYVHMASRDKNQSELGYRRSGGRYSTECDTNRIYVQSFLIDGPGGERIESFTTLWTHVLVGFEIKTNRGRTAAFTRGTGIENKASMSSLA